MTKHKFVSGFQPEEEPNQFQITNYEKTSALDCIEAIYRVSYVRHLRRAIDAINRVSTGGWQTQRAAPTKKDTARRVPTIHNS
jgi:hypothetical protein